VLHISGSVDEASAAPTSEGKAATTESTKITITHHSDGDSHPGGGVINGKEKEDHSKPELRPNRHLFAAASVHNFNPDVVGPPTRPSSPLSGPTEEQESTLNTALVPVRLIVLLSTGRLIISAACAIGVVHFFTLVGALDPNNPLLILTVMMMYSGPTRYVMCVSLYVGYLTGLAVGSTTTLIMSQLLNAFQEELSVLVFWQYLAALFTLPTVITVIFLIVVRA